jgi:hypothetical protein
VATLFDFSPRKLYNMQSYICVKSLVCLDVYKKGGIVCRPKQEVGWKLKKWEAWENELCEVENMRREIQKFEHKFSVCWPNFILFDEYTFKKRSDKC